MSQFLKTLFGSCLGTLLALGVIIFAFFVIGISSAPKVEIPSNSILEISLDNVTPELTDNVETGGFNFSETTSIGVHDVVRLIRQAGNDTKIKGILLRTEMPQVNPATAYYISQVVKEVADNTDKFVHAYGNYFGQSGYMIAAATDSILLNPNGIVDMRGYGTTIPYLKNFSEKTGIDFDIYHAGKYKSAVEPYYLSESSEANRTQTQSYLQGYEDQLVDVLGTYRDIDPTQARSIIDDDLAENSQAALDLGLVDGLSYLEDYEESLEADLGLKSINYVSLAEYANAHPAPLMSSKNRIAIVYAEGAVAGGGDARGQISMDVYEDIFEKIEKNDKIKAVILRVNSGGGSAFTSDVFLDRIKDLQDADKLVVASFGDYAASGGYYIAASADHIFAEPTTLTGSIGVFAMMPNLNEFFSDKMGINWDTIGTGNHTFMYSTMVKKSDDDNRKLKNDTERIYAEFKKIVSDGRGLSVEEVEEIAQGRVWTGLQGLENGLVDQIGNLDDAIAYTVDQLDVDDYKLINYPTIKKTFIEELATSIASSTNAKLQMPKAYNTKLTKEGLRLLEEIGAACEGPQARMPYSVLIR